MKKIRGSKRAIFWLVVIALWGTGCDEAASAVTANPPTPTPSSIATPTVLPSPEAFPTLYEMPGGGPCGHLLWPLWNGAQWTYEWSGITRPPATLQVSVEEAEAVATLTWNGTLGTLYCTSAGLIGLPPLPVGHPELGMGLVATNPRGAFLPAPGELLPVGIETTWDAEYDLSGSLCLPMTQGPTETPVSSGKLVLVNRTLPMEIITLPFGQLSALPVEQLAFIEAQLSMPDGATHGVTVDALVRLYFVEDIGLVQIRYNGGSIAGLPSGNLELPGGPVLTRSTP